MTIKRPVVQFHVEIKQTICAQHTQDIIVTEHGPCTDCPSCQEQSLKNPSINFNNNCFKLWYMVSQGHRTANVRLIRGICIGCACYLIASVTSNWWKYPSTTRYQFIMAAWLQSSNMLTWEDIFQGYPSFHPVPMAYFGHPSDFSHKKSANN